MTTRNRSLAIASLALTLGLSPVVSSFIQPQEANAYHRTNKRKVRKSIKKGGWSVVYSKEFTQGDWAKLTGALVLDYFGGYGSATSTFLYNFADKSYDKVLDNLDRQSPAIKRQFKKAVNAKTFMDLIAAAIKNGRVDTRNLPGVRVKIGKATYNRAECALGICVPTPNTHQPYVAFKILKGQTSSKKKPRRPAKAKGPKTMVRTLKVCNRTNKTVWVAYGHGGSENRMKVHGWRKVGAQKCDVVGRNVKGSSYFFRAEAADGMHWSGDVKVCANPTEKFTTQFRIRNCPSGQRIHKFIGVGINEPLNTYTYNFR